MPPPLQWACSTQVQSPTTEVHPPSTFQTGGHCLRDPSHSRMGGAHLCHVDPLTETCRRGSGPMSPSTQEHHSRALQRLHRRLLQRSLCPSPPSQGMGPCHRASSRCQTPQREDVPPLPHRTEGA